MRNKIFLAFILSLFTLTGFSQVTTGGITGIVVDDKNSPLEGASVIAIHVPSGSKYATISSRGGIFNLPSVRVGGPYKIAITYTGFTEFTQDDVFAPLGTAANVDAHMNAAANELKDVIVTSSVRNPLLSSKISGTAVTIGREALNRTPTIGRTVNDITKYNAYSNGRSFAGQDSRLNNFTIDGSVFNNGFGLGSQAQAGGRTGSGAISLDALEELQINIAPYDIRQSGFVGAAINAVTRSGTNDVEGSVFHSWNNRGMAGNNAGPNKVPTTPFNVKTTGFRLGGPIIKDKLFFFVNGEFTNSSSPALNFVAKRAGAIGNQSRTTYADLEDLKKFMLDNFNWDMGAIDNFNNESFSKKMLARIDYNLSEAHKLSIRYSHHNSESDQVISNSTSAGNGSRQNNVDALSGQNTGYKIQDNTRSIVAELNSSLSSKISNQFLVTYNKQLEDRVYRTSIFPTIDILESGKTYTSLGFDPFTPNNKLNYSTFNITNNVTFSSGKHSFTVGASVETFKSNNLFFFASNGAWVFNSIADFKAAALAYKADTGLAKSPVAINKFQYRYSLLPEGKLPWQIFKTQTYSLYGQDEYKVNRNLRITAGVRLDYIAIPNTAKEYANPVVSNLTFYTPDSAAPYKINTGEMPKSRLYVSPRLGFNLDVFGNRKTIVRGGVGIFLSRMPYVLISNQLGNNGVNIGLLSETDTAKVKNYPFTLNPHKYSPRGIDISKITGYDINYGDPNLKFPQTIKSNIAIDQKLPFENIVATVEFIYNKNINSIGYQDMNLKKPIDKKLSTKGDSTRYIYDPNNRKYNTKINSAYVLVNNSEGYSYSFTAKLEKPVVKDWGGMVAYTYAKSTDLMPVFSTVTPNIPTIHGLNYLQPSYSDNDLRHRFVGSISYRLLHGDKSGQGITLTLGMVSQSGSKISYTAPPLTRSVPDLNKDGLSNDLIFIPAKGSSLEFKDFVQNGITYPADQQKVTFDAYVDNHPYLSTRRGQYAERNAGELPWLTRFDFSVEKDFFVKIGKKNKMNIFRFRTDITNFGNLLNINWGVGNIFTTNQPLVHTGNNAAGEPQFNLSTQIDEKGNTTLLKDAFIRSKTLDDVFQLQFTLRYIFGK